MMFKPSRRHTRRMKLAGGPASTWPIPAQAARHRQDNPFYMIFVLSDARHMSPGLARELRRGKLNTTEHIRRYTRPQGVLNAGRHAAHPNITVRKVVPFSRGESLPPSPMQDLTVLASARSTIARTHKGRSACLNLNRMSAVPIYRPPPRRTGTGTVSCRGPLGSKAKGRRRPPPTARASASNFFRAVAMQHRCVPALPAIPHTGLARAVGRTSNPVPVQIARPPLAKNWPRYSRWSGHNMWPKPSKTRCASTKAGHAPKKHHEPRRPEELHRPSPSCAHVTQSSESPQNLAIPPVAPEHNTNNTPTSLAVLSLFSLAPCS